MVASIVITAVSTVLFFYWFRYTCVLILSTRTTKDYSADVAAANQLSFADVQGRLEVAGSIELNAIHSSLERDFRLVNTLLQQAGRLKVGGVPLEETMLRIDFRLMQLAFAFGRRFSDAKSRAALSEMSQIVAHMANAFGEQAASSAEA